MTARSYFHRELRVSALLAFVFGALAASAKSGCPEYQDQESSS